MDEHLDLTQTSRIIIYYIVMQNPHICLQLLSYSRFILNLHPIVIHSLNPWESQLLV